MGKIILYTISSEEESARRLGFETTTYLEEYVETLDENVIVRWGNSSLGVNSKFKSQEFKNVLNPSEAISLNCNKDRALAKMAEAGVLTPKMYREKEMVPEGLYVYRSTAHSAGHGFNVQEGPFKVNHFCYATEWIQADFEVRVWFCGDQTMIAKRVTKNKQRSKEKYPCRSLYPYSFYKKVPKKLHEQVLLAANAINLSFGAADVLVKEGKFYIVELNSAASIDDAKGKIKKFYKENLIKLIRGKFPNIPLENEK